MPHLPDDDLLGALDGTARAEVLEHLSACAECAAAVELWRSGLPVLRELAVHEVDEREMHQLAVLFRTRGPQLPSLTTWLASLVRCTPQAAVGVRGAPTRMMEMAAGPYHVVMQQSAGDRSDHVSLHGQLLGGDQPDGLAGRVVLAAEDGRAVLGDIDEHGEFHLANVPVATYSVSWWTPQARVHAESLTIEDDDRS